MERFFTSRSLTDRPPIFTTLDGTETLSGAFAALLARTIRSMLCPIQHLYQYQCDNKVAFGIPLFDDLDPRAKAKLLATTTHAFFDPKSGPLADNAYTSATIHAVCRHIYELLDDEYQAESRPKKKSGQNSIFMRTLVLTAFRERCPQRPVSREVVWDDIDMFRRMLRRLTAEIAPEPFFLLADLESTKRNELARRMGISDDYFREAAIAVPESWDPDEYIALMLKGLDRLCISVGKKGLSRYFLDRDSA